MSKILVIAEHLSGALSDATFEMLGVAKGLGDVTVGLIGGTDAMVSELGAAGHVARVDADPNFNPEVWTAATGALIEAASPSLVMVAFTSMGMDLASTVSAQRGMPLAGSCVAVEMGDRITATSNLYGGKMNVRTDLGAGPAIVTMAAGCGLASAGKAEGSPELSSVAAPAVANKVRFLELVQPEASDVDITTQETLVAIGRGIGNADGVEAAQELAEALGAEIAASRPIIDAGWLPKSRQVGKSGLKVSPKVYLALGISGAPEHIEGMKQSATIIAVNTDKNAPIFGVAHYGLVGDLFDVCEELVEALE